MLGLPLRASQPVSARERLVAVAPYLIAPLLLFGIGCIIFGLLGARSGSMSSIKRDVKKKSSALTGGSRLFLEIQPTCFVTPEEVWPVIHSRKVSLLLVVKFESARCGKQDDVNHGSIRGSWPIAISGYPRGHSV